MSELQDLAALIRADTPLLVIETPDETRVVDLFRQSLLQVWRALFRWSITEGLRRIDLDREDPADVAPDASSTLQAIRDADQRGIYLLLDFHPYLGYASTQRQLREILQRRGCQPHVLVLVGTKIELPAELEPLAVRFTPRLPDANALLKLVREEATAYARENGGRRVEADGDAVRQIVRNLQGMSETDARRIARHLIFRDGALGADDLPELAKLKFELLNRSGHLHYEFDTARFADVAGAARLKRWIGQRRSAFVDGDASDSLEPPKGMLLLGVQGCGKSLLAKAVAGGFGVPLVRLDFGTLYGKFHGETEQNLRVALAATEQLAPCVLWIDEIFFVDLPDTATREQVFALHLRKRKLQPEIFDIAALALAAEGFSGAEIEQAIVAMLYAARAEQRPADTALLLAELHNTRPLSVLMAEQVAMLRAWARERTVPAD
jgi:hypothetical protein